MPMKVLYFTIQNLPEPKYEKNPFYISKKNTKNL